ncbi:metal-dependent transcriptional regulator [Persicimonas caeni]|uniref:Manganese transport regulator n=1 Tax=Persicimonas caeni TaxID=2292766 RepID=A0A4Y6Q2U1_PERCE|nr:metal-dependent transcriptional regulator [Persicimonas caeni]QDG54497.1 metal-dependent transcriptional regulator [Persicimonas caeni]QED35718.1 metal-dependent transcriptional regulator [Persicimonas caeni]
MPTPSVENYLKAVYHLQSRRDSRVKTKEIADQLDISLPSVTSMLKSLGEEGMVDYQPYKGARLTDSGAKAALRVIRNHRLIEVFLVQTLGYTWDEVHDEAERLEHAVSEKLVGRIDEFLGNPKFDPHGDPIPTAEGEIHRPEAMPLSDATPGSRYRVERVLDQEPEVLRYLEKIGLTPSETFEVLEVLSFDGQMFLSVDGEDATVSRSLASRLLVTELSA